MAPDPIVRASRIGLGLILAVVIAAAGIRYGVDTALLRPVHRITASLEVPVALWVAWLAWQRSRPFLPAALLVLALTAALSVIGIAGGQNPPPTIAAANLLGGLALVSLFAWMAAGAGHRLKGTSALLLLLAVQAGLGAWITIGGQRQLALAAHGILALVLAALLVRLAFAAGKRRVLVALAVAAPLAGFTVLHYEQSGVAAVAHAAAVALLVAAFAFAARADTR